MDDRLFAALDLGLVFLVVFGIWQLVAVRRSIRRDRDGRSE